MANMITSEDILEIIGKRIKESSLRTVAKEIEVSPAYLSDVMRNRRSVSDTIAGKFGFERIVKTEVVFRKMGK
jgi:hypothetical protein